MSLPLADSGVEQWGFVARVGSYEQQQVTVLDASDARVQQVVGAQVSAAEREREVVRCTTKDTVGTLYIIYAFLPCPRHREELLSAEVFRVESVEEVFEGDQSFSVSHPPCNDCYLAALHALQLHTQIFIHTDSNIIIQPKMGCMNIKE